MLGYGGRTLEVTLLAMAESDGDITGVSTAPNFGDCAEP